MNDKGKVNWTLPASLQALGALPVRLRGGEGEIVAQGLSAQDLEVPVGNYWLGVMLPSGKEIIRREKVHVKTGDIADPAFPSLERDLFAGIDRSGFDPLEGAPESLPPEMMAMTRGIEAARAAAPQAVSGRPVPDGVLETAAADTTSLTAIRWRGDWVAQWREKEAEAEPGASGLEKGESFTIGVRPHLLLRSNSGDELLEIRQGSVRRFFVLPFDAPLGIAAGGKPAISVRLRPSAGRLNVHFTSPVSVEANAFVEFVNNGFLPESRAISSGLVGKSEETLYDGRHSLLQTVLSAYVLLRANDLSEIDSLTERLVRLVPDLADVHIVRMEALARLGGRHVEASDALRDALDRGCPWFRSGVSYLLERLRLYIGAHAEAKVPFELSAEDLNNFKNAKASLERMAGRLDTSNLFATFNL